MVRVMSQGKTVPYGFLLSYKKNEESKVYFSRCSNMGTCLYTGMSNIGTGVSTFTERCVIILNRIGRKLISLHGTTVWVMLLPSHRSYSVPIVSILILPLMWHIRDSLRYPIPFYIDSFSVAPLSPDSEVGAEHRTGKLRDWEEVPDQLGAMRSPGMGEWAGPRRPNDLGLHIGAEAMEVLVRIKKVRPIQELAKNSALGILVNLRLVPLKLLYHFSNICASLILGQQLARVYIRSFFFYLIWLETMKSE